MTEIKRDEAVRFLVRNLACSQNEAEQILSRTAEDSEVYRAMGKMIACSGVGAAVGAQLFATLGTASGGIGVVPAAGVAVGGAYVSHRVCCRLADKIMSVTGRGR